MDDESTRALAPTGDEADEHMDPDLRYEARVSLSSDDVFQSFASDPRVAWYPNANPPAFGSPGVHEFEAWPIGPRSLVVRTNVPASIQTASPYVLIEMNPLTPDGTHVHARFVRRPPGVQLSKTVRVFLAVSCVFGVLGWLVYVIVLPLMLLHPTLWITAVASVGGLIALAQYSKNRPRPDSMQTFGGGLWGIVGSKLVPHALGGGEDPFRLKALGQQRSR